MTNVLYENNSEDGRKERLWNGDGEETSIAKKLLAKLLAHILFVRLCISTVCRLAIYIQQIITLVRNIILHCLQVMTFKSC